MRFDRITLAAGALLVASCGCDPKPTATQTRWDYKVVTPTAAEQQDLQKFLAGHGTEGWELVQVIQTTANSPGRYFWQRTTPKGAHNEVYPPPRPATEPDDAERLYATVDELLYKGTSPDSEDRPTLATPFDYPKYGVPESKWVFKRPAK